MRAVTLLTGHRVHPGFLGLLNRYAKRLEQRGYLAPQTVLDKLVDDTNLSKNRLEVYHRSELRHNKLFIYSTLLTYFSEFCSPVKQNYFDANNLKAFLATRLLSNF